MHKFQLFRIKAVHSRQLELDFAHRDDRRPIIRKAVEAKPSAELRMGHHWHIGNIASIDAKAAYFALGRTTRSTLEFYDEDSGDFEVARVENAPYTHVLIDFDIQVCAIAAKSRLSPNAVGIAAQLERLLNTAESSKTPGVEFKVEPLRNPVDLVREIGDAYAVKVFSVEFSLPNPWDADEDFQKPAQRLLQESRGSTGRTTLSGFDLARAPLQNLTQAAAASGNNAEAKLQRESDSKAVRLSLHATEVQLTEDDEQEIEKIRGGILVRIRELYSSVRGVVAR
jgi:hypothetical protein